MLVQRRRQRGGVKAVGNVNEGEGEAGYAHGSELTHCVEREQQQTDEAEHSHAAHQRLQQQREEG